jgi:hypothetical protein
MRFQFERRILAIVWTFIQRPATVLKKNLANLYIDVHKAWARGSLTSGENKCIMKYYGHEWKDRAEKGI